MFIINMLYLDIKNLFIRYKEHIVVQKVKDNIIQLVVCNEIVIIIFIGYNISSIIPYMNICNRLSVFQDLYMIKFTKLLNRMSIAKYIDNIDMKMLDFGYVYKVGDEVKHDSYYYICETFRVLNSFNLLIPITDELKYEYYDETSTHLFDCKTFKDCFDANNNLEVLKQNKHPTIPIVLSMVFEVDVLLTTKVELFQYNIQLLSNLNKFNNNCKYSNIITMCDILQITYDKYDEHQLVSDVIDLLKNIETNICTYNVYDVKHSITSKLISQNLTYIFNQILEYDKYNSILSQLYIDEFELETVCRYIVLSFVRNNYTFDSKYESVITKLIELNTFIPLFIIV